MTAAGIGGAVPLDRPVAGPYAEPPASPARGELDRFILGPEPDQVPLRLGEEEAPGVGVERAPHPSNLATDWNQATSGAGR